MSFAPKSLEIDPDLAKKLFEEGGKILALDVPAGTEFGLDYKSWTVGDRFKGVKFLPHGIHMAYYSSISKSTRDVGPRTAFFFFTQGPEVVVRKWDCDSEDLVEESDAPQRERLAMAIREFDPFLGTYPLESYTTWHNLTHFVTPAVVQRHQPLDGKLSSVNTQSSLVDMDADKVQEEPVLPEAMLVMPESAFRFTEIPRKWHPSNATSNAVTQSYMDKTGLLKHLLSNEYANNYKALLGELQFAFVSFLVGQCFDAFEHWKTMVHLLSWCDSAYVEMPNLFCDFVATLHWQLKETPEDFFIDIISKNNFLCTTLQRFFSGVADAEGVSTELTYRVERFRLFVSDRFQWDFELEDDDDLPVVVEM
ncbi:hypothetical protein SARC_04923 [Sphaeroforma arctica JP610]|uniref:Protein AAR2 homolog n=1 Tax=Sphaeroforma arctica JP610 TaxID=667725 RepID=A0A0L0G130_9EUKA|nr:hypothetical protein SARC_04923 [Sphaeroforma arctica JP610]KNC82790.1 hypothetical protein SARC_04923 [Sphaeroforma arctica JP610]|eukprot:XP_014156692.1 hypothetical protein SARC_04923 [Sphaeroforma arctica JP610]